jgi:predicted amidophosphoribosyltransferase
LYKAVLNRAFPNLFFSRTFEDRYGQFSWGTYVKRAGPEEEKALADFCQLLREAWLLDDDMTETFALGLHSETSPEGGFRRSVLGQLVYEAKAYDRHNHPGNQAKAKELAARMADLVRRHPSLRQADMLVAVPGSNQDKDYDLPAFLCQELSQHLSISALPDVLKKKRDTKPMKSLNTVSEKNDNVAGVFEADNARVRGKKILVVDDIYQTGFSINEVGRAMREAGAVAVFGVVATKTASDPK